MIENIKRFTDENRIPIVVVTIVLCFCLFYWYIFCKSGSGAYKVSSGDVFLNTIDCEEEEEVEDKKGRKKMKKKMVHYRFIGAAVSKKDPLFVLNENGHALFNDELKSVWKMFYDCYLLLGDENVMDGDIDDMMKNPVYYITKDNDDKGKVTLIALWKSAEKFFEMVYNNEIRGIKNEPDEYSTFVLHNFIPKEYVVILENYSKLVAFINDHLLYYFEIAEFVGQPASPDYDFETLTVNEEIEEEEVDATEGDTFVYVWDCKDMISDLALYKSVKTKLRSWYNNKNIKIELSHLYKLNKSIINRANVKEETEEKDYQRNVKEGNERTKWQIADIFPAFKLIKTVFVLLAFETKYIELNVGESKEDFRKMVASYVVYVHLFNSFCGVKMEGNWNRDIGNIYVYKYKENLNVQKEMKPDYKGMAKQMGKSVAMNAVPVEFFEDFLRGVGAAGPFGNKRVNAYKISEDIFDEDYKKYKSSFGTQINECAKRFDELITNLWKLTKYADILINHYKNDLDVIMDNMSKSKKKKRGKGCFVTKENYGTFEDFVLILREKIDAIIESSTKCKKITDVASNEFIGAFSDFKSSILDSPSQDPEPSVSHMLKAGGKTKELKEEYNLYYSVVYDYPIAPDSGGAIGAIPPPDCYLSSQIAWEENKIFDGVVNDQMKHAEKNREINKKRFEELERIEAQGEVEGDFIMPLVKDGKNCKATINALKFIDPDDE